MCICIQSIAAVRSSTTHASTHTVSLQSSEQWVGPVRVAVILQLLPCGSAQRPAHASMGTVTLNP